MTTKENLEPYQRPHGSLSFDERHRISHTHKLLVSSQFSTTLTPLPIHPQNPQFPTGNTSSSLLNFQFHTLLTNLYNLHSDWDKAGKGCVIRTLQIRCLMNCLSE